MGLAVTNRGGVVDEFGLRVEGETVPGSLTNVTAVPEPHEWLLMGLAVAMLAWYTRARRLHRAWLLGT